MTIILIGFMNGTISSGGGVQKSEKICPHGPIPNSVGPMHDLSLLVERGPFLSSLTAKSMSQQSVAISAPFMYYKAYINRSL